MYYITRQVVCAIQAIVVEARENRFHSIPPFMKTRTTIKLWFASIDTVPSPPFLPNPQLDQKGSEKRLSDAFQRSVHSLASCLVG